MIIGHQKQRQFLKKAVESDRMPHAYLFSGMEKLGKKKVALEMLSLAFGKELENISHPDLIIIEPQAKEIKIEQIRSLIWQLSLKSYSSPLKAVLINKAHTMNQEAQTAFLKTLEEPRGRVVLILISEHPDYLLPAILSRVQNIKFYPVKKKEIVDYLKKVGLSDEKAENISQITLGRPGLAIDLVKDPSLLEEFNEKIENFDRLAASDLNYRVQYVKELAEDPLCVKEALEAWTVYLRNQMLSILKSDKVKTRYSLNKLKKIIEKIQETRLLTATTNVDPKLALEILMLEL